MGVNLRDLIPDNVKKQVRDLRELRGKVVALDAYNALYQFLAAIRQPDGTPLMDRRGRVTSHLSGLFYRTINLVEHGIKPVYVFDGKPPEFKQAEIERRRARREEAAEKARRARAEGRIEEARRYAMQAVRLTDEMVKPAKELLNAMGIPYVQAPAEGEAQAAYIAKRGDAWGVGSQDYDSLLFGAPRLIRNLTITGRRKLPGKDVYVEVMPEVIELNELLRALGLTREQLVDVAILVGTDYNPDGVEGVGPKTAYQLIKRYGSLEKALRVLSHARFPEDPLKIRSYFLDPQVTEDYEIKWSEPDEKAILSILVEEYDFSKERVMNAIQRLRRAYREYLRGRVTSLDMWFRKR